MILKVNKSLVVSGGIPLRQGFVGQVMILKVNKSLSKFACWANKEQIASVCAQHSRDKINIKTRHTGAGRGDGFLFGFAK